MSEDIGRIAQNRGNVRYVQPWLGARGHLFFAVRTLFILDFFKGPYARGRAPALARVDHGRRRNLRLRVAGQGLERARRPRRGAPRVEHVKGGAVFFPAPTAYALSAILVGSEMCLCVSPWPFNPFHWGNLWPFITIHWGKLSNLNLIHS